MALSTRRLASTAPARRSCASSCRSRVVRCSAAATKGGMDNWLIVFPKLQETGLKSFTGDEVLRMQKSGKTVIVDVRPREAFEKNHIEAAVNVPLYQAMDLSSGGGFQKYFKYAAFAFNGVSPIELNPDFAEQMKAASAGGKTIVTYCEAGGTMKPTINFPQGKASRSLQAAYRVLTEGLSTGRPVVAHLERGLFGWYQSNLPIEGEFVPDVGRTPMAASDPTLSVLIGSTGYEVRPGDKK